MSYDLDGNILSLQRYAGGQMANDFAYSYDGNKLISLVDEGDEGVASSGSSAGSTYTYEYDSNGNMTYDGANDLDLSYNHLNLIEKVSQNGAILANYSYLSDGTKLSATDADGNGLVYAGSLVYRKQNGVMSLESGAFPEGRFVATESSNGTIYTPLYYLTDHLGSVRAVVDGATGEVVETNDYYPFGMRWQDPNQPVSDNRYRYNGKEEQNFLNLPFIDYGARMRDPKYGIGWNRLDDLSEVTPGISPSVFCLNNPINAIDTDGRQVIGVHGTWSDKRTWQNQGAILRATNRAFGDRKYSDFNFEWSGGNYASMRTKAAEKLVGYIQKLRTENSFSKDEPITLVGHSHGGNVNIEAINMMVEMEEFQDVTINLLTINTPVRSDYQLSEKAQSLVHHVNVYDEKDPVQSKGGTGYVFMPDERTDAKGTGEYGRAKRTFKNATNIKVENPQGLLNDFHNSHNRVQDWIYKIPYYEKNY